MKSVKRGLALFMACLIAITPLQVNASELGGMVIGDAVQSETDVSENDVSTLEEENVDMITYNTGNHEYCVASSETSDADAVFAEDGSYTINIPEEDPFFPYEVQFKNGDDVTYEWFMNPSDSVQVGGHTFRVNANFTGKVMTQMTLNIAGSTVIAYPEEKEFVNEPELNTESLLPLTTQNITVDLSNYTPMDLKRVAISEILAGQIALSASDKVTWTLGYDSTNSYTENQGNLLEYRTTNANGYIDLSYGAFYYSSTTNWIMILSNNQLNADAKKYNVECKYTSAYYDKWLIPTAYLQRADGTRDQITLPKGYTIGGHGSVLKYGWDISEFRQYFPVERNICDAIRAVLATDKDAKICWGLKINDQFANKNKYATLKAYNGYYTNCSDAINSLDVTNEIFVDDMSRKDVGYKTTSLSNIYITLVSFDASGNAIACLPVELGFLSAEVKEDGHKYVLSPSGTGAYTSNDYKVSINNDGSINKLSYDENSGIETLNMGLYQGIPAYYEYVMRLSSSYYSGVNAIYLGHYNSSDEAVNAGATDLKTAFLGDGYKANYKGGLPLTFVKSDGSVQKAIISVYETETSRGSGNTGVTFYGFKDKDGNIIRAYQLPNGAYDDNYADQSYLTYLVSADVDTSHLKPLFKCEKGINLYSADGNSVEVSGISEHDFSGNAVAYTSSAENKINQQNFWLKVIKVAEGNQALYVSNFANKDATQYYGDGIVRGTREIVTAGYHDIFVINYGTEAINNISVELNCDALTLDDYWTYNGNYSLAGADVSTFGTTTETLEEDGSYTYSYKTSDTRPSNISKLRLFANPNYKGEITGTLRIKSGNKTLVELTLTGTTKGASITTESIRTAVKYVPFGMMIQNDNKYKSNKVSYSCIAGKLPDGVVIKPNGELYGIPLEAGEFNFTVEMESTTGAYDEKNYTWTVLNNTDQDVDNQNDTGYAPTEKVPYALADNNLQNEYLYVSPGTYDQFIDVYLDGQRLIPDIDYTSKSGSTRITIKGQTLASKGNGTHTIGVEFRTEAKAGELKASAQNYIYNNGSATIVTPSDTSDTTQVSNPSATPNNNAVVAISTTYTVQSGDTLWKIAEKIYGNGALWTKIYADNKAIIKNPNRIYVGQVLKIYPIVGDGTYITASTGTGTYIIQSGDTLWKIAKKKYGRSSKWRKIYKANKSTLADPNKLRIGQVIVLPD